jgi:16S rRNA (adenine1518-N6/adenine1519-N6)-dimethyltransferase
MKLSEMKQLLVTHDLQLTKSLGQNFLHDGNQLRRIVDAAELQPADKVLEVGPGLGPLTELLLQSAASVLAIEKDARLVHILRERFKAELEPAATRGTAQSAGPGEPRLRLLHADALDYLRGDAPLWTGWKLVSNLPYAVASPILAELALGKAPPDRLVATLQLEVARRLMARSGDADYGILTLLIQLEYEPIEWFKISSSCFFPEPEVDSACVVLARRQNSLLSPEQRKTYVRLVKRSFSQRRKMMFKLLKADWSPAELEAAMTAESLSLKVRAEVVSLEQFVSLTRRLHERRNL